jgi:hypothetical protein
MFYASQPRLSISAARKPLSLRIARRWVPIAGVSRCLPACEAISRAQVATTWWRISEASTRAR